MLRRADRWFGVAIGAALGVAGTLVATRLRPEPGERVAPAREAAPAPHDAERGPTLAAVPAREPAKPTKVAIDLAVDGRRALLPVTPGGPLTTELWFAIVGTLFLADKPDDAIAALDAAVAAGAPLEMIATMLPLLDDARREALVHWFRERHPKIALDDWLVATADDAAGDHARAFDAIVTGLREGRFDRKTAIERLVRIDAARADAALRGLAAEQSWDAGGYGDAANALAATGASALASRWQATVDRQRETERADWAAKVRDEAARHPDSVQAWADLANLREDSGDRAGAVAAWKRAAELGALDENELGRFVALDPVTALPFLRARAAKTPTPEMLRLLIHVELRLLHKDEALDAITRLPREYADEWWTAGAAGLSPARALAEVDEILERDRPRDAGALRLAHADALAHLGRRDEAFEELAALLLGRDNASGGSDLLLERMARTDLAAAQRWFSEPRPSLEEGWHAFARRFLRALAGQPDELCAWAEPRAPCSMPDRIWLAAFRGGEWLSALERAAKENRDWDSLAAAYELAGRKADAAAAWDRAAESDLDDVGSAVGRALSH